MIHLLMDCFDKEGKRYKVISFDGEKYQCQSYLDRKCYYYYPGEISSSPPKKRESKKFKLTEITPTTIKKPEEKPKVEEIKPDDSMQISEPTYEEEVIVHQPVVNKNVFVPQDNNEETANDFYADF